MVGEETEDTRQVLLPTGFYRTLQLPGGSKVEETILDQSGPRGHSVAPDTVPRNPPGGTVEALSKQSVVHSILLLSSLLPHPPQCWDYRIPPSYSMTIFPEGLGLEFTVLITQCIQRWLK